MRIGLVVMVLLVGCTAGGVAEEGGQESEVCRARTSGAEAHADHVLDLMRAAVQRATENDQRCGFLSSQERQCRALAVAAAADPALYLGDPRRFGQAVGLTMWAAAEGAASATAPELVHSWEELTELTILLGQTVREDRLAESLRRRDVEEILFPLQAAEQACPDS